MATRDLRIAAAQVASLRGDITTNIATHVAAIEAATPHGVSVLVFPELSLTGYEPDLAAELAITADDARLAPLQALARKHQMNLVVGVPLQCSEAKPNLGAILFTADGSTRTYAKMHLGGSEPTFFSPGSTPLAFTSHGRTIGISICADSSQPSHPRAYAEAGATIYAAGVFLNAEWFATDSPRLANYAKDCRMLVAMANHADSIGTYRSVGKSAVWSPDGITLAQADGPENCLVIATDELGTWSGEVVPLAGQRRD